MVFHSVASIEGSNTVTKRTCYILFRIKVPYVYRPLFCQVDFDQLQENLCQMERRCKASWDHLKVIAKHEMKPQLKQKMSDFLKDCAERIIILKIVHRRIINRWFPSQPSLLVHVAERFFTARTSATDIFSFSLLQLHFTKCLVKPKMLMSQYI